jgi:peptidoglycan/LPS O-acetylase OafA/YrhL
MLFGLLLAMMLATGAAALIARMGFPLPPAERRIGCIDGLRGYLALAVMAHHFVIWMQLTRLGGTWSAPGIAFFNQLGGTGVALFFMTTGLVFYPRILAGFRATAWVPVYIGRVFRIMPLIAVSALVISLIIILRGEARFDLRYPVHLAEWTTSWAQPPLLGHADAGRFNAYVLWSLRYEWLFYLLVLPGCALAMDALGERPRSVAVPALLLAIAIGGQVARLPGTIWPYLPLFAIGMLAYECQRRESLAALLRGRMAGAAGAIALVLAMALFPTPYGAAMPLLGVFFLCVACGNDMGGLLRTRGALVLGELSYGIYLLHGIVLALLFEDAAALLAAVPLQWLPLTILPFAALIVTGVTAIAYLGIERPAIAIGRALGRRWRGGIVPARAQELEVAP